MVAKVRVVLEPVRDTTRKSLFVSGLQLGIVPTGPAASNLKRDVPAAASLKFGLTYLEQVRERVAEPPAELAELKGKLMLTGTPLKAVFTPDPVEPLTETQPADTHVRHTLDLSIHPRSAAGSARPLEMRLFSTDEQDGFRLAELSVALSIDGAVEASAEQNDTLDVPLDPGGTLRIRIEDPQGNPLAKHRVIITQSSGFKLEETTDDDGIIVIQGHQRSLPVEIDVVERGGIATKGAFSDDSGELPEEEEAETPVAIDGCAVEFGDTGPVPIAVVIGPDEDTDVVVV